MADDDDRPSMREALDALKGPPSVFEYDADAHALYYRLTAEPVVRTIDIDGRVLVDVDAAGKAVGIEVLNAPGFSASAAPVAPLEGAGNDDA